MDGQTSTMTDHGRQSPLFVTTQDLAVWHQFQGFKSNDCAAFSLAIVANAVLQARHLDGQMVARELERLRFIKTPLPHLALWKIPGWITFPWGISGYLRRQGILARCRWLGKIADLQRNLSENRPTVVIVGEPLRRKGIRYAGWAHAKVLYGYEPVGPRPARGLYFVDPGVPATWSQPSLPRGVTFQNEEEFWQQWRNMFRMYVEVPANN